MKNKYHGNDDHLASAYPAFHIPYLNVCIPFHPFEENNLIDFADTI